MDQLDVNLGKAWRKHLVTPPAPLDQRLKPAGRTMTKPLRSHALVLRANDKRWENTFTDEHGTPVLPEVIAYHDWLDLQVFNHKPSTINHEPPSYDGASCAIEAIPLTPDIVARIVTPILIPWPGVSIDSAARTFGVNRTTIHRWVKAGRLTLDRYPRRNGSDTHRASKQVWTPRRLDPGGAVWSPPWEFDPQGMVKMLHPQWKQTLRRSHRCLGKKSVCMFWQCPGCSKWVYKVYLPLQPWTMLDAMGIDSGGTHLGAGSMKDARFTCRKCADLLYESAERTSAPSRGRTVDHWDRFIRRLTKSKIRGKEV